MKEIFTTEAASVRFLADGSAVGNSDALEFCRLLRDEVVDVAFVDPPFNLGKNYGKARHPESSSPEEYRVYMERVLAEVCRSLTEGGSLFLYHVPQWAMRFANFLETQLEFRHWIAISMKNGFARGRRLYPAHYALLYFTKGVPANFKRPRYEARRCRHCGELVKDYGGYRKIIEEKGVNLSDFWDDLSPVRHAKSKLRRGNQLPVEMTDRVLAIAGKRGGVFLDPFVGTGTSAISGLQAGMRVVVNDLDGQAVSTTAKRLEAARLPCSGPASPDNSSAR